MENVNHDQLKDLIIRCYHSGFPLFVYGGFGIGKSQTQRRVAEMLSDGREYLEWNRISYETKEKVITNAKNYFINVDLRLAQLDPSDINGIPDIGGDRKYLKWNPPAWAIWSSQQDAKGFLFFDEANLASPAVMKAFYQVIHDREIGDIKINDDVGIMSAGNRQKDNAGVKPMPKPLQDRYFEVELKVPEIEEWEKWAIDNQIDPHIISFLNMKRDYLYVPRESRSSQKPASPRGWEQVSKILGRIEGKSDPSYLNSIRTIVSSRLGEDVAGEFAEFLRNRRRINIRDYIENPEQQSIPDEADLKWTLVSGIVNWYRGLEDKGKKGRGLNTALKISSMFEHKDFALNLAHQVKMTDEDLFVNHADKTQTWQDGDFSSEMFDFLTGDFE